MRIKTGCGFIALNRTKLAFDSKMLAKPIRKQVRAGVIGRLAYVDDRFAGISVETAASTRANPRQTVRD
jgi:hypothetical protein